MAVTPKQLANLKPIKKGEVRNPNGNGGISPAVTAFKKLTIESYREVIELVLNGNVDKLQAMSKDKKNISAFQAGIARAFLKAISKGDYAVIERIAERIVGKIPDEIKIDSTNRNMNLNVGIDKEKLRKALLEIEDDL